MKKHKNKKQFYMRKIGGITLLLLSLGLGVVLIYKQDNIQIEEVMDVIPELMIQIETKEQVEEVKEEEWNLQLSLNGVIEPLSYPLEVEQIESLARKWSKSPSSGQLIGWDLDYGRWQYSDGEEGIEMNQEETIVLLEKAIEDNQRNAIIEAVMTKIPATRSAAQTKEAYQVMGEFSTTTTSNQNRNTNIQLAVDAIDRMVVYPGEEFSFNLATGNRTSERGYQSAGAYQNGVFVEEPGGGVCQVSTTLYNAILTSGLNATERNPHSFAVSYVSPGEDAMVSYDGFAGPDLKFINTEDTSVAIRATFDQSQNLLKISLIGIPILEEGIHRRMESEKVKETPIEIIYEEDSSLPPQTEVVVTKGESATVWKTYLILEKGGEILSKDYFRSTSYKGKQAVIRRNSAMIEETMIEETMVEQEFDEIFIEEFFIEEFVPGR